jgi:hypothetical protein
MNYEPTKYDVMWLQGIVDLLKVGGIWVAPMGFTFRKTGENQLELVDVHGKEAQEMVRRTVIAGKKAGIKVIVEDDKKQ